MIPRSLSELGAAKLEAITFLRGLLTGALGLRPAHANQRRLAATAILRAPFITVPSGATSLSRRVGTDSWHPMER